VGDTGLGRSRLGRIIGYKTARTSGPLIVAPLVVGDEAVGVLRLEGPLRNPRLRDEPEELLRAFAVEAALGVQRLRLARIAAESRSIVEASEAKTDLMMAISHNLKTPLAAIKTSVSSLLDGTVHWSPEDTHAFLETIESQADYLNRAISDLLDMNRLESGAVRPILRSTSAADLLSDAVERAGTALAGRSVLVQAEPGLDVTLDRSLVEQALVNLLENAAKYSAECGAIRLASRRTPQGIEIEVSDEGPGIDAAEVPRIFERFYRAPGDGRTAGTGLGLALARAFVRLSGGEIRVESSPGGTRFLLLFPQVAGRLSA
jgi:two-component system sensor histidine kinase KdpD